MNVGHSGSTFSNQQLRYPPRSAAPALPTKKPIPKKKDLLRNKAWSWFQTQNDRKLRPGFFSSTPQMYEDCWFMSALKAVANDKEGQQILDNSIQRSFFRNGWNVVFAGAPGQKVYVSEKEVQQSIAAKGGTQRGRILEIAANKFFSKRGNFRSLYLSYLKADGADWLTARLVFWILRLKMRISDSTWYNPMRQGAPTTETAFYLLTGIVPAEIGNWFAITTDEVMKFLHKHVTRDLDGPSVTITPFLSSNPFGYDYDAQCAVYEWDCIRADIGSDNRVDMQERNFLYALADWLESGKKQDLVDLKSEAAQLKLKKHYPPTVPWRLIPRSMPESFVRNLASMRRYWSGDQIRSMQNAVENVLNGECGFVGFIGSHALTLLGVDTVQGTFTYTEPHNPTVEQTGILSDLVRDVKKSIVWLHAVEPTIDDKDEL